jgi:transposase
VLRAAKDHDLSIIELANQCRCSKHTVIRVLRRFETEGFRMAEPKARGPKKRPNRQLDSVPKLRRLHEDFPRAGPAESAYRASAITWGRQAFDSANRNLIILANCETILPDLIW